MIDPASLAEVELFSKLRGIRNLNEIIQQKLTGWQRVATFIAETATSRGFLLAHAIAFVSWIAVNALLGPRAWDPYPFLFLCFWASVQAIFLSLFILVSQDTQSQKDRLRNEQDYPVATKLHFEIMQLHHKLDAALQTEAAVGDRKPETRHRTSRSAHQVNNRNEDLKLPKDFAASTRVTEAVAFPRGSTPQQSCV